MLDLQQLSVGHNGKACLSGVTATFPQGSFTAILGRNGSGKSTLMETMAGILPVIEGSATLDGKSLGDYQSKELARHLAYLPQKCGTPDITVERLLLHGRFPYLDFAHTYGKHDKEIVSSVLQELHLTEQKDELLSHLSGGVQRKVFIGMKLVQQTDTLLLDEPTTFLDIDAKYALLSKLRQLADGGKAIVAVQHDVELTLQFADRFLIFHAGKVAFYGNREQLLASGAIEEVFGMQVVPFQDHLVLFPIKS